MECYLCGKAIEPTKKTVIKRLVYKKGEIHKVTGLGTRKIESYGFLHLRTRIVLEYFEYTVRAKIYQAEYYFICPICSTKTVLSEVEEPCYYGRYWEVLSKEKKSEIRDD